MLSKVAVLDLECTRVRSESMSGYNDDQLYYFHGCTSVVVLSDL